MKREGSPLRGVHTVAVKEAADHIASARMHLIMLLLLLVSAGALYAAIGQIKETTAQNPYLFLQLLTAQRQPLPSFASLLGFLLPLLAIGLGFDAVNGEFNRRTLSRILAQPIYRDALLFGKFLGGLLVIAVALLTLWLLTTGVGMLLLGLPPGGDDLARGLAFLVTTLVYSGVWLAVAIAFSTLVRSPATSALAALALWLVLSVFWNMLAPLAAAALAPIDPLNPMSIVTRYETLQAIGRISPANLYSEIASILLDPTSRSVGPVFADQMEGAVAGAPLSTLQSILIVWPQIASMFAAMVVLFTLAYVVFQRQEVRA
ncbi:MAG TPA: ABC transporter permease [Hypericibacter adhaerens]|uniref:ABC transporter permease n=1 Tax=Hypericibacter adhaerens TaxID=2602016 RepID=UPI002BE70D9A|nr:ABC transporter permease [Hypericibacter adhaerens]HWA43993.1 ABC transporter permease [Hypericibacter adhaerens]